MHSREYNFDGLVGPTHHYAGLSHGNVASLQHAGRPGNPRAAALEGLKKMRFVSGLGVGQGVLPPQPRPDLWTLRRLGFSGTDRDVLARALTIAPRLLSHCSSASSMWAANAATVSPSSDTFDGRVHFTPANLVSMFHRSLEATNTTLLLRRMFADRECFVVHDPLPAHEVFGDEGAANHTRLLGEQGALHLFGWGRTQGTAKRPNHYPARQAREASEAVIRSHELAESSVLLWQQEPLGIDLGAFHTDVLWVGNESFVMAHEFAFVDIDRLLGELQRRLGDRFRYCLASESELPATEAVATYPFNSQVVTLPSGRMAVIAPRESQASIYGHRFIQRILAEDNPVSEVHYIDVNGSMRNGGGPACLRLRVTLTDEERAAVVGRVFLDDDLHDRLGVCITRHYRDRLTLEDLADPIFVRESQTALDEITQILGLGSVYAFQL
ncbi:MAG TPA: N-succinylarginine dihydrolase [Polyangiaceae bacterium]|nr:N-succinylarginine dihydrolase [Polyangiaceae bacterium]